MSVSDRSFNSTNDLITIGTLIRRAYARVLPWNAWSFARFDIWAHRRIADETVHGRQGWHQDIRLWETEWGRLVGAVLFESDHSVRHGSIKNAVLSNWNRWAQCQLTGSKG